ncbi:MULTISPECIES: hypothetical protein [Pseudomonas]|jgi:hypothetical protein|uniref:Uncharacterized protein n=1 Tax=Pseudomonas rhodesiae TaxID=76760 RepID=A0A8I1DZX9_9PSED|nr:MULTISPECIES: hypothetical protein [Pseudomonas]MBI6605058.1 hypothetical protein [Pseudomonas sp. S4_EA_1b]MBI6622568.1 hypothetical protein [Pseudomonas rhodesiae]MDN6866275.1 hypothetical protein [Pseudomonas rhodesiae]NMY81489.1 hypothetical protein [Pseudomonas rhodesiae]NMZ19007.1 hypothetical protein [Pseudomonas rhodesiae]
MTKYKLEFRHRPNFSESIEDRHNNFLRVVSDLGVPWGLNDSLKVPPIGSELVTSVSLDKLLPVGVKGRISYALRDQKYLEDDAQFDDTLFIEFTASKVDYSDLLKVVFPRYIKAFGSYRSALHDWSVTRSDWPLVVEACEATKKDVNGRDGVFRINAANYFDKELCFRAFGKGPRELVDSVSGCVEEVREFEDGVLIVISYNPLSAGELLSAGDRLKSLVI